MAHVQLVKILSHNVADTWGRLRALPWPRTHKARCRSNVGLLPGPMSKGMLPQAQKPFNFQSACRSGEQ